MFSHAASLILAGFVEADGGTVMPAKDNACPSILQGVAGEKPFRVYVTGARSGEGASRWTISVPCRVLDESLGITVIGAIKSHPMTCTFIFMPRLFLKILGTHEGDCVRVGLSVNPFKGGFVTDNRPWPIIQGTSSGFPEEPVPKNVEQYLNLVGHLQ